jgi:gliding motility-associated protein GldE
MISDDPYPIFFVIQSIIDFQLIQDSIPSIVGSLLLIVVFLILSALFSASENALFSLSSKDMEEIKSNETPSNKAILTLLQNPKKLLATILIANNFVNVSMIIVSSSLIDSVFVFKDENIEFIIKVLLVTFILLLFGEVIPKIYSIKKNRFISKFMAFPLIFLEKLFYIIIVPLLKFSSIIDKRVKIHEHTVSADELTHAIDITSDSKTGMEEKEILKGIVNFGNKTVRQIMKGRVDVSALDVNISFKELLQKVNELGYSRFPIYDESFDNICGILFVKEILPHINEPDHYDWKKILKPPFYVPDTKRIDVLLEEFQEERNHMAIVVDEYGGKLGIVTMEDILEEIFGEINDEFDDDQINYSRLDANTYVIEGKMLINDFCKIIDIDSEFFEKVKGDSESVAGMLMEIAGRIPQLNETIIYQNFSFIVEAVDNRRIKRIKVVIK